MTDEMHIIADRDGVEDALPSKQVVGNTVVSAKGREAGSVDGFFFEDDGVIGLDVSYDHESYFIDIAFVEEYQKEAVMLTIQPFYVLQGVYVYDDDGRYLGKVADVTRAGSMNDIEEIVVKRHPFSKALSIPAADIKTAHDSVILNCAYDN